MMDIDTLVGRLMELETKFYELQDRYQSLINDYEKLKEEHDAESRGYWEDLTYDEIDYAIVHTLGTASKDNLHKFVNNLAHKLKVKNEKNCARHRNQHGTRYNSPSGDAGH